MQENHTQDTQNTESTESTQTINQDITIEEIFNGSSTQDFFVDTEIENKKGHFKIFLGYCAGVGKTYRMLQEANSLKKNNLDIVIGLAETHGRKETENLISDLEIIPRKQVNYAGINITEMDLDAILQRNPQAVLVDELAHTNIPGSRHTKRYQDVEELLNAGIDVYSTLNIQHVQSLADIVQQIINIKVDEIIPDRILEIANEIELVDLPIEKLLQRLSEGKVYIPQKAKQAMQKFFQKGNLLALRELSLKYTAKRVDIDLLSYREEKDISNIWPVESKLLVCLSSGKIGEKLLLIGHRMAKDLNADWFAVNVESLQQVRLSEKARTQLYKNIHLAEELGAKVVTLSGNSIADELVNFAKSKNITLIIAGLSKRSRLQEFFRGSVLNKLVKKSSPINILVVGDENAKNDNTQNIQQKCKPNYKPYFYSLLILSAVTGLASLFSSYLNPRDILALLFSPVIIIGLLWGGGANLFSSICAMAIVSFFFIPPKFSFAITDLSYLPSFVTFAIVSTIINVLSRFMRWRTKTARYREKFISALYNFGHEMMLAETLDDILNRAVKNIAEAFETEVMILLPDKVGQLELATKSNINLTLHETEKAVAFWVYKNGHPAGKGTNTLSSAQWYYLPMKINDNVLGVVCVIKPEDENANINTIYTPEQKRLLEAFANIVGLSLTKLNK